MIQVGNSLIELLPLSDPTLPTGQVETYRLFAQLDEGKYSANTLCRLLGLKSELPLQARIEHLASKGIIKVRRQLTLL